MNHNRRTQPASETTPAEIEAWLASNQDDNPTHAGGF